MRSRIRFVGIAAFLVASACGDPTSPGQSLPTTPTLSFSPAPSLSPSPTAAPTASEWKTYSNSEHGFSIEYPSDYLTELFDPRPQHGVLFMIRFFDEEFAGEYPDGQVELEIYTKDAGSLDEWLAMHSTSSTNSDPGPENYYFDVSNRTSAIVNDNVALAFDWQAVTIGTVHEVAFLSGDRVVTLDWFGKDKYQPIFDRMLDSYKD